MSCEPPSGDYGFGLAEAFRPAPVPDRGITVVECGAPPLMFPIIGNADVGITEVTQVV